MNRGAEASRLEFSGRIASLFWDVFSFPAILPRFSKTKHLPRFYRESPAILKKLVCGVFFSIPRDSPAILENKTSPAILPRFSKKKLPRFLKKQIARAPAGVCGRGATTQKKKKIARATAGVCGRGAKTQKKKSRGLPRGSVVGERRHKKKKSRGLPRGSVVGERRHKKKKNREGYRGGLWSGSEDTKKKIARATAGVPDCGGKTGEAECEGCWGGGSLCVEKTEKIARTIAGVLRLRGVSRNGSGGGGVSLCMEKTLKKKGEGSGAMPSRLE